MAIEVPVLTFLFIYIKYAANRRQGLQPLTGLLTNHPTFLGVVASTLYPLMFMLFAPAVQPIGRMH